MEGKRFDTFVQSLSTQTSRRGAMGVLAGAAALGLGAGRVGAQADKVVVCHATGSGSFNRIEVSRNALPAHLRHGDAQPGDPVPGEDGAMFGDDCGVVDVPPPTEIHCSDPLVFGPNGWGGWSCPAGMTAVGGSYDPASATVQVAEVAEPGSVYPHHTFGPDESGFVVHNDNDQETITVCVECVAS